MRCDFSHMHRKPARGASQNTDGLPPLGARALSSAKSDLFAILQDDGHRPAGRLGYIPSSSEPLKESPFMFRPLRDRPFKLRPFTLRPLKDRPLSRGKAAA